MRQRKDQLSPAGTGIIMSCLLLVPGGPISAKMDNPYPSTQDQTSKSPHEDDSATASGGSSSAGLRIVDPETGEMVSQPTPGIMSQRMVESMETSDVGLHEEPDAAGGTMVDLQGRFKPMLKLPRDLLKTGQQEHPGP